MDMAPRRGRAPLARRSERDSERRSVRTPLRDVLPRTITLTGRQVALPFPSQLAGGCELGPSSQRSSAASTAARSNLFHPPWFSTRPSGSHVERGCGGGVRRCGSSAAPSPGGSSSHTRRSARAAQKHTTVGCFRARFLQAMRSSVASRRACGELLQEYSFHTWKLLWTTSTCEDVTSCITRL